MLANIAQQAKVKLLETISICKYLGLAMFTQFDNDPDLLIVLKLVNQHIVHFLDQDKGSTLLDDFLRVPIRQMELY